tara:strand:+ start:918 stop:1463 length:546 start_codon:yes stop_codon:yes gene_type:complete
MESNKQERKNLVDKSPMAMMKSKKPSTAFAMKMSETKSGLPMKGDLDKDGKMSGYESKRQMAIEKNMSDSPAKMYGGKKGDMSKSKRDYDSPAKMSKTPLKKHEPGHADSEGGTKTRPNSKIKTKDRATGAGRVYSKSSKATKSTTGTIGGNTRFRYISDNKIYEYIPGVQNKNPKTGRLL